MQEFLRNLLPNVMGKLPVFYESIYETLIMVAWSGAISFVLGAILGVMITVTKRDSILENTVVYQVLDKVINFFRAIPFIILLAALFTLTRAIMGTAIGVRGAIVPLVFGTVPFFARQIESALAEVNPGLIEAAQSMGSSPFEIIFRVYLKESVAPIARATTITAISLIGLTAMAGAIGAGGLGDFAIRYGYQRSQEDVTYVSVIVIVLLVSIIQGIGNLIAKKSTH
jgi:D-methionine transport system permease protein